MWAAGSQVPKLPQIPAAAAHILFVLTSEASPALSPRTHQHAAGTKPRIHKEPGTGLLLKQSREGDKGSATPRRENSARLGTQKLLTKTRRPPPDRIYLHGCSGQEVHQGEQLVNTGRRIKQTSTATKDQSRRSICSFGAASQSPQVQRARVQSAAEHQQRATRACCRCYKGRGEARAATTQLQTAPEALPFHKRDELIPVF